MKSERRHELQQNELADWLGEKIEATKPYATQIALGVVLVVLAIFGAAWFFGGDDSVAARSWESYQVAMNQPRDRELQLQKVMKEFPSAPAALWAQMAIGDQNASEGARAMFSDRPEAQKQLKQAESAYKFVVAAAKDPQLKGRAEYGLGRVYESLCKPEEAVKHYEAAAALLKDSALGEAAAEDGKRMKDPEQVALLGWFAEQTPKRPAPIPGLGGGIPGLPNDLPARPDISVPDFGGPTGLNLDNIGTGVPTTPAPDFPAPGTTPPTAPDANAPATPTTPAPAEPKTGDPKPTEPKPAEPTAAPKSEP
jgi:tetratricopeptide (TPR) repeat protein